MTARLATVRLGGGASAATMLAIALAAGLAIGRGHALPLAAAVALLIAVGASLLDWRFPVYGLLLYLPFSGIPVILAYPHTAVPVLVKDFLFVLPAYVGLAAYLLARREPLRVPHAPVPLLVMFATLVVVEAFNPALPNHAVGAIGVKVWLLYIPLYFLGYHLVDSRTELFRLLRRVSIAAIVPALVAVVEAVLVYSGHSSLVYRQYGAAAAAATQNFSQIAFDGGGVLRRIPSTFSSVTQHYGFMGTMVAVCYAWWRGSGGVGRRPTLRMSVWLLALTAVFLTGARAAFLFIPPMVALMFLLDRRRGSLPGMRIVAVSLAFAAAVAVIGASAFGVVRQTFATAGVELRTIFFDGIRDSVVTAWAGLGSGIDTVGSRYALGRPIQSVSSPGAESWFVKVVLELGIVGLVLVVLLLGYLAVAAVRQHRRLRDDGLRAVSAALTAFLVWNIALAVKGRYLDVDPLNVYFWLLLGVLARLGSLDRTPAEETAARDGLEP